METKLSQTIPESYYSHEPKEKEYKTSKMAWIQLLSVVLVNASCGISWTTASSAPDAAAEWMKSDLTQLNWLSNTSAVITCILSLTTPWAYEKYGLKTMIIFSSVLNAVGCWIRYISIVVAPDKRYYLVLLGQAIGAIGGPYIYSIATKFVAVWFAGKDRGVANALSSIQFGMFIAPLVMPVLASIPDETPRLWLMTAIFATTVALPTLFFPKKPKNQPSATADIERMHFKESMINLAKNPNYWCVTFLCSTNLGIVYAISVLVIQAITPYNYTAQESGMCGSAILIGGIFGGLLSGYWVGKTGQYLMLIKIFAPLCVASYIMLIFQLIPDAFAVVLIACLTVGFFAYALLPLYLEFTSETTYPISESMSSCVIWSFGSAFMLIFSVILDSLREGPDDDPPYNMKKASIVTAAIMVAVTSPVIWLKGDLKRLAVDNQEAC
ncbi:major facilitator superfamily domain-containing protein [Spinellus fusiger]|nr:major facilitator superfamily domain-containing protein [Spinellus fusiger]